MMNEVTFKLAADAINASIVKAGRETVEFDSDVVEGISIDTRTINKGDIYLALKGERVDGHEFISQAVTGGCKALIVDHFIAGVDLPQFVVSDTGKALVEAAKLNRQLFKGPVIALTGSSGKTSTKNILNAILSSKAKTLATHGNFNNEIGVPLTLLSIESDDQYAVIEMGARAVGDIAYLVSMAQPDISILLNAGHAHIDIFGSYENIVKTKGEIYQGLDDTGLAVVNYDDPAKDLWLSSLSGKQVITFSLFNKQADLFVSHLETEAKESRFTLHYQGEQIELLIPLPGVHSVKNTLAAVAAVLGLGFSLNDLVQPLSSLTSTEGRLNSVKIAGMDVIDDSYNANPASVKAAIDVLAIQKGMRVVVLAEMAELGDYAEELHLDVAQYIAKSPIEKAFFLGRFANEMAQAAGNKGVACDSKDSVVLELESLTGNENKNQVVTVLIKGSRSTRMEEVREMLERRAA